MKQNVHLKESCVEKLMAFTYYKFDRGLNIKKTIIWDEFYEIHTGKLGSISVILFYQCHLLMQGKMIIIIIRLHAPFTLNIHIQIVITHWETTQFRWLSTIKYFKVDVNWGKVIVYPWLTLESALFRSPSTCLNIFSLTPSVEIFILSGSLYLASCGFLDWWYEIVRVNGVHWDNCMLWAGAQTPTTKVTLFYKLVLQHVPD